MKLAEYYTSRRHVHYSATNWCSSVSYNRSFCREYCTARRLKIPGLLPIFSAALFPSFFFTSDGRLTSAKYLSGRTLSSSRKYIIDLTFSSLSTVFLLHRWKKKKKIKPLILRWAICWPDLSSRDHITDLIFFHVSYLLPCLSSGEYLTALTYLQWRLLHIYSFLKWISCSSNLFSGKHHADLIFPLVSIF